MMSLRGMTAFLCWILLLVGLLPAPTTDNYISTDTNWGDDAAWSEGSMPKGGERAHILSGVTITGIAAPDGYDDGLILYPGAFLNLNNGSCPRIILTDCSDSSSAPKFLPSKLRCFKIL